MAFHTSCSLVLFINSVNEIPPCHHLKPSSIILLTYLCLYCHCFLQSSRCCPLPLFSLSDQECLSLLLYVLLSLAFSMPFLLVTLSVQGIGINHLRKHIPVACRLLLICLFTFQDWLPYNRTVLWCRFSTSPPDIQRMWLITEGFFNLLKCGFCLAYSVSNPLWRPEPGLRSGEKESSPTVPYQNVVA